MKWICLIRTSFVSWVMEILCQNTGRSYEHWCKKQSQSIWEVEWQQAFIFLCISLSLSLLGLTYPCHYYLCLLHFYLSKYWLLAILCAYISPRQTSYSIFCLPVNMAFQYNLKTIKIALRISLFPIPWQETRIGWDCLVVTPAQMSVVCRSGSFAK